MKLVVLMCALILSCVAAAPMKPKQQDYVVVYTERAGEKPVLSATSSEALNKEFNPKFRDLGNENATYPLLPSGQYYWQGSENSVAPPPSIDEDTKNVHGMYDDNYLFKYDAKKHGMEKKTPLYDPRPCSLDRILSVSVQNVENEEGYFAPVLPSRYGCMADNELSREKASPSITWGNYSAPELKDFSLQMISMGDEHCTGEGADGYNRIHWHIVGMKPVAGSTSMTLAEAASKDSRLLYGGHELPNQWLEEYYGGPCPAPGSTECFRFKVLAHLLDGETCYCGHQDVLFTRPVAPKDIQPIPVLYNEPILAPIGNK